VDVNHYCVNEIQAIDRTLEQIIELYLRKTEKLGKLYKEKTKFSSVTIIGSFNLSFHNQHDVAELKRLFSDLNITINEIIPEGNSVDNIKNLPKAWFNLVFYREICHLTAKLLENNYNMPYIDISPMGIHN